jgi:murein DD-endopeptidase MepM/ murein hydrolase activator NlpD
VPPADDAAALGPVLTPAVTPALTAASRRSPRLARVLLLSAFGAGLLGLAVPDGTPAPQRIALDKAAASTTLVDDNLSAARIALEPAMAARVTAPQRASRQRAVPVKRVAQPRTPTHERVASVRWVRPSYAAVVSFYGPRWGRLHKGIDFGDAHGDPIRAIGDGIVVGAGYLSSESGYGQITLIRHANGMVSAYAHQSRMLVRAGDRVTAGEVIGRVGSTGNSTGAHLHFELRSSRNGGQVNPLTWLRRHGVRI